MALIKTRSRGINLADTFAFSGTVSGAGGGKINQVIQSVWTTSDITTSNTSFTATGHLVTIQPSATSSKVLIHTHLGDAFMRDDTGNLHLGVFCNVSGSYADISGGGIRIRSNPQATQTGAGPFCILHSPNTTSSISYQMYFHYQGSGGAVYYQNSGTYDSRMIAMEVLA